MNNKDLKIYLKDDKFIVTGDVTDEAELIRYLGRFHRPINEDIFI